MYKPVILKDKTTKSVIADFLRMAVFIDAKQFSEDIKELNITYDCEESKCFFEEIRDALNLLTKIDATSSVNEKGERVYDDTDIELTKEEAKSFSSYVDFALFQVIRADDDINNPNWLYNILAFQKICDGTKLNGLSEPRF